MVEFMAGEVMRVRCAARPEPVRVLERRLRWWTERLVDSSEPLRWHLTTDIDGVTHDGMDATCRALQGRPRPRSVRVQWELLVDSADGGQVGAFVTGRLKRNPVRRARLLVSGTDPAFAARLAQELSHSRWQLRRPPLPSVPLNTASDLIAAGTRGHPSLRRVRTKLGGLRPEAPPDAPTEFERDLEPDDVESTTHPGDRRIIASDADALS